MAIIINPNSLKRESSASQWKIEGKFSYTTYETGGSAISATSLGLSQIKDVEVDQQGGLLWDPVIATSQSSVNIKVYNAGGGTWAQTPLLADSINIIHEAAHAATAVPMYLTLYNDNLGLGQGWWWMADRDGPCNLATVGGIVVQPRANTLVGSLIENLVHDPVAPANGTRLFWRPSATPRGRLNLGHFVSNNSTAANQLFTLVDSTGAAVEDVVVYYDPNAANDSIAVQVDETLASGLKLIAENPYGISMYVQSISGRYVHINHSQAGFPDVYFNDVAGDSRLRLLFISPTVTSQTNTTATVLGLSDIEKIFALPIYCNEAAVVDPQNRLQTNFLGLANNGIWLPIGERMLHIAHNPNAAIDGVQVFFDNTFPLTDKLRFISPSATSATAPLDPYRQPIGSPVTGTITGAASSEVPNLTDLSPLGEIDFQVWGL